MRSDEPVCTCGTPGLTYAGPDGDCAIHGRTIDDIRNQRDAALALVRERDQEAARLADEVDRERSMARDRRWQLIDDNRVLRERLEAVEAEHDLEVTRLREWTGHLDEANDGLGRALVDERASVTVLEAQRAAVLALHTRHTMILSASSDPKHVPMTQDICRYCYEPWPCATGRALTADPTPATDGETT